ncbi:unnamed protein product [Absidia cylindrospora]
MSFDGIAHYIKESLFDSGRNDISKNKTNVLHSAPSRLHVYIGWYILCQYFSILVVYVIPLLPLLYYCYSPKKAKHIALVEWCRDQAVVQLNHFRTWYISRHPPHLFLLGLYGYISWVTLHQLLPTRWIVMLTGLAFLTHSHWYPLVLANPEVKELVHFLLPPPQSSQASRQRLVQRALDYQQQFMVRSLDKHQQQPFHTSRDSSDPFTFVIYENQRRSPLTGSWHSMTFPLERTPWTDENHYTVLPKQQFVLPSPVQLDNHQIHNGDNTTHTIKKVVWTWVWVDSDWHDEHDWEYGNMVWTLEKAKSPASSTKADGILGTRRKKWQRRAILECTFIPATTAPTTPASMMKQQQQQQQQNKHALVIETPPPSTSTPMPPRATMSSPLSPQPSLSSVSLHDYQRRPNDFSSSQISINSTNTNATMTTEDGGYPKHQHASYRDPKRSSSRSTRRQAVWKSIVKT